MNCQSPGIEAWRGQGVRLSSGATFAFPGGSAVTPPGPDGIAPLDFSYDFKTDLVLAGVGGVRLDCRF